MDTVRVEKKVADHTAQEVFAFVLDVERYPRLMTNVNEVRIVSQQGDQRVTRWDTDVDGAPLIWTEQDTIRRDDPMRVEFELIEGDFDVFRGRWEVVQADGEVSVVCELEYHLGIEVIEELLGPVLSEHIASNLQQMLDGLVVGIEAAR